MTKFVEVTMKFPVPYDSDLEFWDSKPSLEEIELEIKDALSLHLDIEDVIVESMVLK